MKRARTIMIQGTASSVGKSLLVTALCRIYARRGLAVAPFKAQNMSLNSAVTPEGAEIGRAQYTQALAARVSPFVDMNPILLKPDGPATSQVVVLGRPLGSMHFSAYHAHKPDLREVAAAALERLRAAYDLVILEGAGSPAEVNLKDRDFVNMWMAARADAPVVLVTDIERGGALAALVGTLALIEPHERARVRALVVNKFRGDPALFVDGVRFVEERTGVRVAGVVPHLGEVGIASEDSLDLAARPDRLLAGVVAVKLPYLSNFDELEPLARDPNIAFGWHTAPKAVERAQLVILPGTKCTVADLAWLRRSGLAGALVRRARAGRPILGICGGFQLLGERILDPDRVESSQVDTPGLGLLPVVTRFFRDKVTRPAEIELADGVAGLDGAGGARLRGYEIHCGRVEVGKGAAALGRHVEDGAPEGAVCGAVAGTLVHGLFENPALREALGGSSSREAAADPYDLLADHFERALDLHQLDRLIENGGTFG